MARQKHVREVIRLAEIADRRSLIENADFEDCEIHGPAVALPLAGGEISGCSFDGPVDAVFWEIAPERSYVGVIGMKNVSFRGCRFRNVGFVGTAEFVETARRGMAQD